MKQLGYPSADDVDPEDGEVDLDDDGNVIGSGGCGSVGTGGCGGTRGSGGCGSGGCP